MAQKTLQTTGPKEQELCQETGGGFTLPGEAGYEALTLTLAERWGADVIRDSDGTTLSDEILQAGYDIYSTICLIRDHNEWAGQNPDKLQQTFLITEPIVATIDSLEILLMKDFFTEQFVINDSAEAIRYWQVYDRTTDSLIAPDDWSYQEGNGSVCIKCAIPFHQYTVSFLAYRIWEEISMYNHTANGWDKEHLMQIDPVYPETREYMKEWLHKWCLTHTDTTVVRFTSMFYNFAWIWGSSERRRTIFTDWGSYDFTVSVLALDSFAAVMGYELTAEDFVNGGKYRASHMPADTRKRDWMKFVNGFVVEFGKELVDIVHGYNKLAYVFYDDSWIGIEPYDPRFTEFGFDGLIKCVFSGFEARLCANVDVPVHELRLHPYLFPVGLGGAPTFAAGGNPTLEAKKYWLSVRRALLRQPVERIGLGGYLHLVEEYPDFCDYMECVADEFRKIRTLHKEGKPTAINAKVAILHYWGELRSWTLSGHFHETYMHDLIHIIESLSGLPIDVSFISFDDVKEGALEQYDIIINAGNRNTAWSGGAAWEEPKVIEQITKWVYEGGAFIGVGEPSAYEGTSTVFRMAHILGVDIDMGERVCHGKWRYEVKTVFGLLPEGVCFREKKGIFLTDGDADVLLEAGKTPILTSNRFGQGKGIYLSSFSVSPIHTRFLFNLLVYAAGEKIEDNIFIDNLYTECAYYPASNTLVIINNSDSVQEAKVTIEGRVIEESLEPFATVILQDITI